MAIDIITPNGAGQPAEAAGSVAQTLLNNGMNTQALRTNATLRKDEWIQLDTAIVEPARQRLTGITDLIERNLVFPLTNAMGTLVVQHETASEMTAADVTMDAVTRSSKDRTNFSIVSTPVPIIHKDFSMSVRALEASRRNGQPLDTTQAEEAARQVSESAEDMVFNGLGSGGILGFGASTAQLFGYTTRTNRNTVTLSLSWSNASKTGQNILDDVTAMLAAAQGDRMYGPYMLYVHTSAWIPLMDDFKTNSDKSILQRLRELPDILDVKVADKLAVDNIVLVQMTKSNVDLLLGMQPTVVAWESEGGMQLNFKVMSIMVPRIKVDAANNSGVVHLA